MSRFDGVAAERRREAAINSYFKGKNSYFTPHGKYVQQVLTSYDAIITGGSSKQKGGGHFIPPSMFPGGPPPPARAAAGRSARRQT